MPSAARTAAAVAASLALSALPAVAAADTYEVTAPADAGPGSLRQAIVAANGHANAGGPDRIRSTLPSDAPIVLAAALPSITDSVDLDLGGARIEGAGFAPPEGALHVDGPGADGTVLRGLYLDTVGVRGVFVDGAEGVRIECELDLANALAGIEIGSGAQRAEIRNSTVLDNPTGIVVRAPNVVIADSVVAGNTAHGVALQSSFAKVTDTVIAENGSDGVRVENGLPFGNAIGPGNQIEDNGGNGINFVTGIANVAGVNRITGNALGAINLGEPGLEANDAGDVDQGANFLQNFPVLSGAGPGSVTGSLDTTANTQALIHFFADPAGGGDLTTFLGSTEGLTNAAGTLPFTFTPGVPLLPGWSVNAFATTPDGSGPPFAILVPGGDPPALPSGSATPGARATPESVAAELASFARATRALLRRQRLALSISGRTLRTWTDYRGLDPELSTPGTSYRFRQDVFRDGAGRWDLRMVDPPNFARAVPFGMRPRANFVRVRKSFPSLPAGRRILVRYRLTPQRGGRLPKVLRVRVRQRFTLSRPGFAPLSVRRTRIVRVRRR